ncbi:uncharacterized protein [Nicotiana tomentosiformis]|uniref:uncharacterized protein isoform X2 n=1 Tax=Nicotiana tomentosiformis TaxID=4098 RepID=UPI00051C82B6|nr:uncharacterized protein LOC104117961 isoform X2 [Nicotiana tomentosiformis]
MTTDTTTPSYWLNWRFLLCAIWILAAMVVSIRIIWKYEECSSKSKRSQQRENGEKKAGILYKDDVWKTCYKAIHPNWLLAYRLIAFAVLLSLLIADVVLHGVRILYFYTQWTFTLVTVYFGLGSSLSIHGCFQSRKGGKGESGDSVDTERGTYTAPIPENANVLIVSNGLNSHGEPHVREAAGPWSVAFQIIFQMTAGAVVLTDCVFWLVIYPFLTDKNYRLHFLAVCMHSVNAVCLLGDVFLNRLRFPFFRVTYFVLWTCVFVIFQWILHIFVSMRWPYPFLDLSSQYAPLWYFAVGILHLPCYGFFALLIRMKKCWLSRLFHSSVGI